MLSRLSHAAVLLNGAGALTAATDGVPSYASLAHPVVRETLAPCLAATASAIHSTFRLGSGLPNIKTAQGPVPPPTVMWAVPGGE